MSGVQVRVPFYGYTSTPTSSSCNDLAGSAPGLSGHLFPTSTLGHRAVVASRKQQMKQKQQSSDDGQPPLVASDAVPPKIIVEKPINNGASKTDIAVPPLNFGGLVRCTSQTSARESLSTETESLPLHLNPSMTSSRSQGELSSLLNGTDGEKDENSSKSPRKDTTTGSLINTAIPASLKRNVVSPEFLPMTSEQLALQQLLCAPATAKHLSFFASVVSQVLATNSKHLLALQLNSRRAAAAAAAAAAGQPLPSTPCSAFLQQTSLAQQQQQQPVQSQRSQQITAYDGLAAPSYTFEKYLQRIARYTAPAPIYFVIAFIYMDRIATIPRSEFAKRFGKATKSSLYAMGGPGSDPMLQNLIQWWEDRLYLSDLNLHRLFLSCIVVAIKFWSDNFYDNLVYGRVGGVSAEEMLSLELSTLVWLDFKLLIDDDDFVPRHNTSDLPSPEEFINSGAAANTMWMDPADMLPSLLIPTMLNKLSLMVDNDEIDFESALSSPMTASSTPSPGLSHSSSFLDPLACSTRQRLTFRRLIELLATPGIF